MNTKLVASLVALAIGCLGASMGWAQAADPIPLAERYRAVQTLTNFQRLLWLDDVWTRHLKAATMVPKEDVATLQLLSDEMLKLIIDVPRDAQGVREIVARNQQGIEADLPKGAAESQLPGKRIEELLTKIKDNGGFANVVQHATTALIQEAKEESHQLAAKMQKIAEGNFAQGDLRKLFRCGLYGAAAGAFAAFGNWGGVFMAFAAADKEGCFG